MKQIKHLFHWGEKYFIANLPIHLFFLVTVIFFSTGCDPVHEIKDFLGIQEKKTLPAEVKKEMSQAGETASPQTAGELAKANSELLFEMMTVVFNQKDVDDKSNFGALVNSLNDGASLEGIYRGIIMGSRYRSLEAKSQAASPDLLKAFAVEMADLQADMKNPTEFLKDSATKAPSIDYPTGIDDESDTNAPQAAPHSQEIKPKRPRNEIADEMLDNFIGASPYTLKRVIGDEALKKLDELKDSPGELAQWYAKFVLHMCDMHVDFGLKQRNMPDFGFHFKFAQTMSVDRVKWEVLNRYHRYLNSRSN
jgi:hypothetical protein